MEYLKEFIKGLKTVVGRLCEVTQDNDCLDQNDPMYKSPSLVSEELM